MHVRPGTSSPDVEEVVIVTTDIEEPEAVAFSKFKDANGAETQTLTVRQDGETATRGNPNDSFVINEGGFMQTNPADPAGTDADDRVALYTLIKAGAFSAGGSGTVTYEADDDTTTDVDEAFTTMGEYNGAMGTYKCSGTTDCTVTLDTDGKITAISTGWIFTPNADVTSDQLDYDYVHYGFWLKKTTDDGVVTYNEVETFAGASRAALTDVDAVEGTASYKGGATGVYVKNVYNPDRTIKSATSGHFTAEANLKAYFGGTDVAESMHDTLTGTIDKFMLSGGEENEWSVALETSASSTNGTHSGTAKGGDGDGSFSAQFHGTAVAADTPPSAIVGEFNAGFTDGSVAGAFGAQVQDD